MPRYLAEVHDSIMKNYFETSKFKNVIGLERFVLPINKGGYLVPCTLMIKILPNLDEGIQIVGFLKDVESGTSYLKSDFDSDDKVHYLIYGSETGMVHGITHSCYTTFGIPASLCHGNNSNSNELTLDTVAPELLNQKSIEEMRSPGGCIITLDTALLQSNYMLGNDESDAVSNSEDGNGEGSLYSND